MTELLDKIAPLLTEVGWLTPVLALLAGVITSFMPCALSTIPLVVGYVGGTSQKDSKKAFRLSLIFILGMAVTNTGLAVAATLAGKIVGNTNPWWYIALGVLMVFMALQTWGIYEIIPSSYLISKNTKKGGIGAFVAGLLGGIFSSPCATPVLIVLLAIVSIQGNILWGILLFVLYSIGHGVLSVIAGTSLGFVQKLAANEKYGKFSKILTIGMGFLILAMGLYMFYLGF
ncbi:MAG: Thiol:disulfide interchange protein DsbD precursor [Firmicutes bacterium ADurb.Bin146]|nr:MAG: Thiol:disulfide interchange protein DsbD precursor [Firmicutes bacterium ADurb.Bin146]